MNTFLRKAAARDTYWLLLRSKQCQTASRPPRCGSLIHPQRPAYGRPRRTPPGPVGDLPSPLPAPNDRGRSLASLRALKCASPRPSPARTVNREAKRTAQRACAVTGEGAVVKAGRVRERDNARPRTPSQPGPHAPRNTEPFSNPLASPKGWLAFEPGDCTGSRLFTTARVTGQLAVHFALLGAKAGEVCAYKRGASSVGWCGRTARAIRTVSTVQSSSRAMRPVLADGLRQ